MPTYDYKCWPCNLIVEQFHTMDETPKYTCEKCDGIMQKNYASLQISIPEIFKGFYDVGQKRFINSKREIKEIEKREGKVFAHDKELDQEVDKNKRNNEIADAKRFDREMEKEVGEALRR